MQTRNFALSLTLIVGATSPCLAQGGQVPDFVSPQIQTGIEWNFAPITGDFGRAEVAQLTQDMVPDMVLVRGNAATSGAVDDRLIVLYGPSSYVAEVPLAFDVADFAIVRQAGPFHRDAIAVIGATGLSLVTIPDASTGLVVTAIDTLQFVGAHRIHSVDYDLDGDFDILGLRADREAILVAVHGPAGFTVQTLNLPSGLAAEDFRVTRKGSGVTLEFAVVGTNGLHFVVKPLSSTNLSLRKSYSMSTSKNLITDLPTTNPAIRRVAWIASPVATPNDQLLSIVDSTSKVQTMQSFSGHDIRAIAAADLDRDSFTDLVLTRALSTLPLALRATNESLNAFELAQEPYVALSVPLSDQAEPAQHAWPALADLDNDGDIDVSIASDSQNYVALLDGEVAALEIAPTSQSSFSGNGNAVPLTDTKFGYYPDMDESGYPVNDGDLHVGYSISSSLPADTATEGHRIQVIVWRQEYFPDPNDHPTPYPYVEPDSYGYRLLVPPSSPAGCVEFDLDVHETEAFPFPAVFWIESRIVIIKLATQRVVTAYPAEIHAFGAAYFGPAESPPPPAPSYEALLEAAGQDEIVDIIGVTQISPLALSQGAVMCGGLVRRPAVPIFPPGSVPRPTASTGMPQLPQ